MLYSPFDNNIIVNRHLTLYILDCLDERAVRKAFVYLKENLNFYYLRDEFIRRNLLSEKELKECTTSAHCTHFRNEKILKLIIKKKRCKEFVRCMKELPEHKHIIEKIREIEKTETQMTSKGNERNKNNGLLMTFWRNIVVFCFVSFLVYF